MRLAYNAGAFAGAAYRGKLKSFDHYARQSDPELDRKKSHVDAIAFFHRLKAKGFAVDIQRTVN